MDAVLKASGSRYLIMKKNQRGRIRPVKGIPIAIAAMWGLGTLGVSILVRSHHWRFFGDGTMPTALALQVLCFYGAYFGARLPSVVIAGYIIGNTDVRRPYLTALVIVFLFQILMLGITLCRWPWTDMQALPWSVPLVGEIVSILLLTASAALGVWWPELWDRLTGTSASHPGMTDGERDGNLPVRGRLGRR